MIARLTLLVLLVASSAAHCEPELLRSKSFSPVTIAKAVNYYVALGEEATYKEFASYPAIPFPPTDEANRLRDRVAWLLRILYQPRDGIAFRRPAYGSMGLEDLPLAEWPLLPIVQSGPTYFALGEGYSIRGLPESALDYLNYCRANGRFRTTPVPIPTRAGAERDAEALFKLLESKNVLGTNVTYIRQSEEYVKSQIHAIPEQE